MLKTNWNFFPKYSIKNYNDSCLANLTVDVTLSMDKCPEIFLDLIKNIIQPLEPQTFDRILI